MANEQNLIPGAHKLTVEEQSAGGKASGEARRRKKNMQETMKAILDMPMKPGEFMTAEEIQSLAEVKGQNITVRDAIAFAQTQKALAADTRAAEFVLAASDEKPAEKIEVSGNVAKATEELEAIVAKLDQEDDVT